MSLTHCNVHFSQQPDKVAYISTALLKSLKLSGAKSVRLRLGKDQIPATVKPIQKAGRHLYLTSGLRNAIRVPKSGAIYLRNLDGDIQLGPLIGVLSDGTTSTTRPFGSRTGFIKQLLREGSKNLIFLPSPLGISTGKMIRLTAIFCHPAGNSHVNLYLCRT